MPDLALFDIGNVIIWLIKTIIICQTNAREVLNGYNF
jgi:hypothetical protein